MSPLEAVPIHGNSEFVRKFRDLADGLLGSTLAYLVGNPACLNHVADGERRDRGKDTCAMKLTIAIMAVLGVLTGCASGLDQGTTDDTNEMNPASPKNPNSQAPITLE